jgi:hypothetical protein
LDFASDLAMADNGKKIRWFPCGSVHSYSLQAIHVSATAWIVSLHLQ